MNLEYSVKYDIEKVDEVFAIYKKHFPYDKVAFEFLTQVCSVFKTCVPDFVKFCQDSSTYYLNMRWEIGYLFFEIIFETNIDNKRTKVYAKSHIEDEFTTKTPRKLLDCFNSFEDDYSVAKNLNEV